MYTGEEVMTLSMECRLDNASTYNIRVSDIGGSTRLRQFALAILENRAKITLSDDRGTVHLPFKSLDGEERAWPV